MISLTGAKSTRNFDSQEIMGQVRSKPTRAIFNLLWGILAPRPVSMISWDCQVQWKPFITKWAPVITNTFSQSLDTLLYMWVAFHLISKNKAAVLRNISLCGYFWRQLVDLSTIKEGSGAQSWRTGTKVVFKYSRQEEPQTTILVPHTFVFSSTQGKTSLTQHKQ